MISLSSPHRTRAHGWPAGAKLAGLCVATGALFLIENLYLQTAACLLTLLVYALPGWRFFRAGLAKLRLLWPFLAVIFLWHAYEGSYAQGLVIALRMITTVALANLVTMTTRLSDMIDVVQWLTTPVRAAGLQTRALEISMALVVRMTPVLLAKAQDLAAAWQARSHRRPNWRIVLPFTLLVLDDAEHVSDAIRARGGLIQMEDT